MTTLDRPALDVLERRVLGGFLADPERVRRLAGPAWGPALFRVNPALAGVVLDHAPDVAAIEDILRGAGAPGAMPGLVLELPEAEVRTLVELAPPAREEVGEERSAPPDRTRLLSAAAIFAPLPPVPYLCQPLDMAPGAPLLLAGYGFSGKTVAAQDLALAVAAGTPAWGRFPVRAGRALHVDFEQGSYLTRFRYQRLAAGRGIDPRSLDGRLVLAPMPGCYLDGDAGDELVRLAEGFDLVIIDSFRAACPRTDENSSEARVPLDRLTRISEDSGATFMVIHHARKPSQNATGGAKMSVRGSGALFDACGSVVVFAAEKGEPITVEHEKARISGRPHDAFQLVIEDVDLNGEPAAGLRVSSLSTTPAAKQSGSERLQELQGRVLVFVGAQGGTTGGLNVLHEHLGGRKQTLSTAIAELVRAGRLTRGGTSKEPTLSLTGTT